LRRGERCCRCHVAATATSSPLTGSSCCLAAARRHADSVDAVLPFVTALDVVAAAGPDSSAAAARLRPPTDPADLGAAEKPDADGVFYTANSQRTEASGRVSDLLAGVSWRPEHDVDVYHSLTAGDRTSSAHVDDATGKQLTVSDATCAGNDRGQPTLLVDFH